MHSARRHPKNDLDDEQRARADVRQALDAGLPARVIALLITVHDAAEERVLALSRPDHPTVI